MRVLAYCAKSFEQATQQAAGVAPLTSPPLTAALFDPLLLSGHDLIYFDLHGGAGDAWWYGAWKENNFTYLTVALTADQVRRARLGGAVVFALNCHLADRGSPMLDALLAAGARYVIGGDGRNWAGKTRSLFGASLLGLWFRRGMEMGLDPLRALGLAKRRVRLSLAVNRALRRTGMAEAAADTLAFRAYYREKRA
jgi:hypothetical protein